MVAPSPAPAPQSLLEERFVGFLRSQGYPDDSILRQWGPGFGARPDLAVLDPKYMVPLAFFDVKSGPPSVGDLATTRGRLIILTAERYPNVPFYLVHPDGIGFRILRLWGTNEFGRLNEPVHVELPSFEKLRTGVLGSLQSDQESKKDSTITSFKWVSWSLAVVAAAGLVADVYHPWITRERLALGGLAIGLVLIPFVSEFV